MIKIYKTLISIIFFNISFCSYLNNYNTDEFGNVYMYVNILGHVSKPGTYKIYENTDIFTVIASAGGPLPGANLKKINLLSKNGPKTVFNLESVIENKQKQDFTFKPNDSIFINQSNLSLLLENQSIFNTIITILNIYFLFNNE